MSRTGSTKAMSGMARSTPVAFQRGVGSEGVMAASSQGTGQTAISECVEGAKRERLSSRLERVEQASMAKISTKGSAGVPPKLSHSPSGRVLSRVLPGNFRKGCDRTDSSPGRPRNHRHVPLRCWLMPGGRCGHCRNRTRTSSSSERSLLISSPRWPQQVRSCAVNSSSPRRHRIVNCSRGITDFLFVIQRVNNITTVT